MTRVRWRIQFIINSIKLEIDFTPGGEDLTQQRDRATERERERDRATERERER